MDMESMSPKEMVNKIAQLDYSASRLKVLNADMRQWLDAADDEMASLRSENDTLRKQMADLMKLSSEQPEDEAERCRALWVADINGIQSNEERICEMEKKSNMLKEQNEKLTEQLRNLQDEVDRSQENSTNLRSVLLTFQFDLEEAQFGLQHRDEIIDQKIQKLKHLEETVDECFNIIQELRTTNQELRMQLEDKLNESYFAMLSVQTRECGDSFSPSLSFAEEIQQLLASSVELNLTNSTDLTREETEPETKAMPQNPGPDLHTKRFQCHPTFPISSETTVPCAKLLLFFCILVFLTFIVSENLSLLNTLWSRWYLIVQPYWNIQYGSLPPI